MTMLCKASQGVGIDNIAYVYVVFCVHHADSRRIMSEEQRSFIHLAKTSAQHHLETILSNPRLYLGGLRYGMDFVWGKLIFSGLTDSRR